jgi:uncharacterized membrane protein YqjE
MNRLPLILTGFSGVAGQFGGIAAQMLQDRLELLGLELREAKIRLVQALLLACVGVVFALLGLLLLVLAGVYALPPEWRLYGIALAATASILAGIAVFVTLFRLLSRKPLAFDQTLNELKKDTTCFSTRN